MHRMRVLLCVIAVLSALAVTCDCFAWGQTGHRVIGQIAWSRLTPDAKAAIRELLGDVSLGDACFWADEMRGKPEYEFARPLHYVNVAREAEAVDTARDCPDGACVVAAIRKYLAAARSMPRCRASSGP